MGAIYSPRGKVLAAYRIKEADPTLSNGSIGAVIGVHDEVVRRWLLAPARFDPYYDPIAVRRALAGDAEVYDSLTHYEERLVVGLLERADKAGGPVTDRFPRSHREKVQVALRRRRSRIEAIKPSHHRIAELKLTPEVCGEVKRMRQKGIDFAIIGRQLGLSRSSVFRALKNAA